jgi:hypothetical protein
MIKFDIYYGQSAMLDVLINFNNGWVLFLMFYIYQMT